VFGCSDDTGWLGGYPGLIREYRQSVERRRRRRKKKEKRVGKHRLYSLERSREVERVHYQ
jgi:CelD/BcsL family acetyltransferase involved in cellulose biosynthesis